MGHGRVENPARFTRVGGHAAVHTVLVIGHRHQHSLSRRLSKSRLSFDVAHGRTKTGKRLDGSYKSADEKYNVTAFHRIRQLARC